MSLTNEKSTEDIAHGIRKRVFLHTMRNNGGYLSQACSAAESLAFLYNEALHLGAPTLPPVPKPFAGVPSAHNPDAFTGAGYHGPFAAEYDRFFVSPAHYALVIYSALIEVGRMDENALDHFNKDGGSVEMIGAEHSPGMEVTTGSLAQGLSMASGVAFARKRAGEKGKVWVYMSDGEFQEGQTWECISAHAPPRDRQHPGDRRRQPSAMRRRHVLGSGALRPAGTDCRLRRGLPLDRRA